MTNFFKFLFSLCIILTPVEAFAAKLIIDKNGILNGATGVSVGDKYYDVIFEDGSCDSVFAGCQFDFSNSATAFVAAQALLDQVFLGIYDRNPSFIKGCTYQVYCAALIPYLYYPSYPFIQTADAINYSAEFELAGYPDYAVEGDGYLGVLDTSGRRTDVVFARFTPSSFTPSVPEPSTWLTMLIGFGALGTVLRRNKRRSSLARQSCA